MVTILDLPVELLDQICGYILPRKPMRWSRLLQSGNSSPTIEARHSFYYGYASNFALTCTLFYAVSRRVRPSAVVAGHRMRQGIHDYPDRQLLSWIHRNHKYPLTFAAPVRELYIGIHNTVDLKSFSPKLLELLPESALPPGLEKPSETPSPLPCCCSSFDNRCEMAECESYLVALLLGQLRNLEDLTMSTTADALRYTSRRCRSLGSPFLPSLRSVGLQGCTAIPLSEWKMDLDMHTVSDFIRMGPEVCDIRIQDFRLTSVDGAVLRNMTSITLSGVDVSESEYHTLLRDCTRLSKFKYSTKGRWIEPSKIIDGLRPSKATLQTLCLDFRRSKLYYEDLDRLGRFESLENLWIGGESIGLLQDHPLDNQDLFSSTLPASLKRLHIRTTAAFEHSPGYEVFCTYLERLAKECLFYSRPNLEELGLRQPEGSVGGIIETFQMAGVKALSRADDIPMAW